MERSCNYTYLKINSANVFKKRVPSKSIICRINEELDVLYVRKRNIGNVLIARHRASLLKRGNSAYVIERCNGSYRIAILQIQQKFRTQKTVEDVRRSNL